MKRIVPLWLCTLILICCLVMQGCGDNGIYPSPTGTAVYLGGEGCTVNADATVTLEQFQADLAFCEFQFRLEHGG